MDKNTIKAIVLAMLVMLLYPMLLKKFYPAASQKQPAPIAVPKDTAVPEKPLAVPALSEKTSLEKAPAPAVALLENSFYRAEFSTLGGTITGRDAGTRK